MKKMKFKFLNGKVSKIDTYYYSETHVKGGPGLLTNRTEVSSYTTDACKVDLWIEAEGKEQCITLSQPFKALVGHDITLSYDESGAPIELINNNTGSAIWFSAKARRTYRTTTETTVFETKAAWLSGKALVEMIYIYLPLLLMPVSGSPLPMLWTLGALVYFGRKATPNLNGGWKLASVIYSLPVLILPLFGRAKEDSLYLFALYFFISFFIIFIGKSQEKIEFKVKEHTSVGYNLAKAEHYEH
ncbi:hypothetical protein [Shewanella mangrovisoli]|uniref:hypothetical protein n=1 Tax=Shewanella mangrovisoli TaxID=2864211 RepID=UPI0035BB539F